MSEHEVNTLIELMEIFTNADEETRSKILEFSQTLIERPDLLNLAS